MLRPQPTWLGQSLLDFSPEWFLGHGLKGLLLDLDETLCTAAQAEVPEAMAAHLRALSQAGLRLGIVSNNSRRERVGGAVEPLGLPWVGHAKKPLAGGFQQMLDQLGLLADEVAVVGDQLYTDVLGGQWLGARTLLVAPLGPEHKRWRVLMRQVEAWALGQPQWPQRVRVLA